MTILELETYFNSVELPKEMRVSNFEYIHDVKKFVESHLSYLKHNPGNKLFEPYYNRLIELKNKLENDT